MDIILFGCTKKYMFVFKDTALERRIAGGPVT